MRKTSEKVSGRLHPFAMAFDLGKAIYLKFVSIVRAGRMCWGRGEGKDASEGRVGLAQAARFGPDGGDGRGLCCRAAAPFLGLPSGVWFGMCAVGRERERVEGGAGGYCDDQHHFWARRVHAIPSQPAARDLRFMRRRARKPARNSQFYAKFMPPRRLVFFWRHSRFVFAQFVLRISFAHSILSCRPRGWFMRIVFWLFWLYNEKHT